MDEWYPRVTSLSQQRMEPRHSRRVLSNAMAVDRSPVGVIAMQKLLLVTALAAVTLLAPLCAVKGQSDTEPAIAPASRTVNLTAEQREKGMTDFNDLAAADERQARQQLEQAVWRARQKDQEQTEVLGGGIVRLDSWAGRQEVPCEILKQTPHRFRVRVGKDCLWPGGRQN